MVPGTIGPTGGKAKAVWLGALKRFAERSGLAQVDGPARHCVEVRS